MPLGPPFTKNLAIDVQTIQPYTFNAPSGLLDHVPDQPNVRLEADAVRTFLQKELGTPVLDRMYDWLWLCASKNSHRIDPLHQQILKGRAIIPIEDPGLHLIWFTENICLKPIPFALLNFDFWTMFLDGSSDQFNRRVALGFLRSYSHLIQYPSDLRIATDKGLIPHTTTWIQWARFIKEFESLSDAEVAKRYHFGQIRLSRLNILIRLLRPRKSAEVGNNRHYYTTHWNTEEYLGQFVGPGLFVFASVSLLLSAMQVVLSLPTEIQTRTWVKKAASLSFAFWGFCVTVLILLALLWLLLLAGPVFYIIGQQVFGYNQKKDFDKNDNSKGQP